MKREPRETQSQVWHYLVVATSRNEVHAVINMNLVNSHNADQIENLGIEMLETSIFGIGMTLAD